MMDRMDRRENGGRQVSVGKGEGRTGKNGG